MGTSGWNSSLAEFVYNAVSYRVHLPKSEFLEQLKEWELKPVEVDGKLAAVCMVKGNEVHVAVSKDHMGRWLNRGTIKAILGEIIAEHGQAHTSVSYGNEAGRRFVERLGFVPDSITYTLEKLKHA